MRWWEEGGVTYRVGIIGMGFAPCPSAAESLSRNPCAKSAAAEMKLFTLGCRHWGACVTTKLLCASADMLESKLFLLHCA